MAAVEQARTLPTKLAGLPVTVVSQALQASMRVQQQVTELAIRGDEVLAGLRPVEETPEWATFDEDLDDGAFDFSRPSAFDRVADEDADAVTDVEEDVEEDALAGAAAEEVLSGNGHRPTDPWALEERALAARTARTSPLDGELAEREGYDDLSLPQLRARLRRFSVADLTRLLDYERANENRPSFVGMLTRRIATVRDQS